MKNTIKTLILAGSALCVSAVAADELKLSPPADEADAVPMLRDALIKCREQNISKLVLEPGTWHLHAEKAEGMFRHISNHDPGYKRVAFHLDEFSDFEIDGSGATLLCHGVMIPFAIDNSQNIIVRNLTIDWDKRFHLEGTVTAVGEDYFEVEMLPECEAILHRGKLLGGVTEGFRGPITDDLSQNKQDIEWNYWVDPVTRAAARVQAGLSDWHNKTNSFAEVTKVGPNTFRLRNAHRGELPEKGSVMVCKGTNRLNRLSPAIHLSSTDGVVLEDITVHHAGGMGVIAEDCTDPTLRRVRVELRKGSKSLITTTADATHFVACRGTVTVEECLFENMLDDSCNVHGVYAIAEGLIAPDKLAVSFSHFQQLGTAFARPGDKMRLMKRDTLLPYGDTRVITALTRHNQDYYVLTLDKPIDGVYQDNSSVENLNTRPGLVYRDNLVRNNRARGILVTAGGKVVIEDNRFERPSMSAVLIEGDNHVWYESGAVEDVTIRNNTFIGHSPVAPLFLLAPMQPGAEPIQPIYHRNIRIVDNTIEAASPVVVKARRISGLEFSNNRVTFKGDAADSDAPAFQFTASEDITLNGNKLSRPARIETNPADTEVRLKDNGNLSRK